VRVHAIGWRDRLMIFTAALMELAAGGAAATALNLNVDPCPRKAADEIVVCGSRDLQSPYRLPNLPHTYDRKPIVAQSDAIPGVHTRAHVESEVRPDGLVDKRLLITFSMPF
jgi:hypothetical protein